MKKAIVVYDTRFGNTEKIAKALAQGIAGQGTKVECLKVEEVKVSKLADYDLIAIGGPTHVLGVSQSMKKFLGKLRNADIKGKKAFAFDTKLKHRFAGSAAKGIEKRLRKLGLDIVKPHVSAMVAGKEGPLEDGMTELFRRIAVEIAKLT
ncbi:MAG: flavodoxin family protein [Candidatus Bathyarchaeota archaeon]|nr:flavodoxin family protein [Candidatus Bathyarchaeota archaeon]